MNVPFTDRAIRASRQQILMYLAGLAFILGPEVGLTGWILENVGDFTFLGIQFTKWISLLQIISGGFMLAGARSFLQRKQWDQVERENKTYPAGKETPPSK